MLPRVVIILLLTCFKGSLQVRVKASIYIENLTQRNLVNGRYWTNRGKVNSSPKEIKSGETQVWETQKKWFGISGTSGIIVYDIDDSSNTTIAIVWEAPYNFALDDNNLALGILSSSTPTSDLVNLFQQLDDDDQGDFVPKFLYFPKCYQKYKNTVEPCQVSCLLSCQSQVRLIGTMGTSHKPKVHVKVLPLDEEDLFKESLGERWKPNVELKPGTTFMGTSERTVGAALASQFAVSVTVVIENLTRWNLLNGRAFAENGKIKSSPVWVRAGQREIWEIHKTEVIAAGSSGILTYQVENSNDTLAIVWDAPFSFEIHSNNLAIGVIDGEVSTDEFEQLFDDLDENRQLNFSSCYQKGQHYFLTTDPCEVLSTNFNITGTMGTNHHPQLSIKLLPLTPEDSFQFLSSENYANANIFQNETYPGCGLELDMEVVGTVSNGKETKPHQYPWMVFICARFEFETGEPRCGESCGGSLVTPQHILTAAHCVAGGDPEQMFVFLGSHSRVKSFWSDDDLKFISGINIYPEYEVSRSLLQSPDIAVLELEQPVVFGKRINTICLPFDHETENLHENEAAVVAGWGIVDWESSNTSDTLIEATVNIRPNDWCKSHSFLETFYDESFHLCTYNDLSDSSSHCKGDSGGPLFLKEDYKKGRFTQIAVASFGPERRCGEYPAGFSRITAPVLQWIKKITGLI